MAHPMFRVRWSSYYVSQYPFPIFISFAVVRSVFVPFRMAFSTNSKDESIANAIFMFYLPHAVISAAISLSDVSSKRWQLIGIPVASGVRCVQMSWQIAVSYATRIGLYAMNVMPKLRLLDSESTCATSASKL